MDKLTAEALDRREAKRFLTHTHEGPVTPFVLCSRACELASTGRYSHETVANALWDELRAAGYLSEKAWDSVYGTAEARNTADG